MFFNFLFIKYGFSLEDIFSTEVHKRTNIKHIAREISSFREFINMKNYGLIRFDHHTLKEKGQACQ